MIKLITVVTEDVQAYVGVYLPVAGWKSVLLTRDEECGGMFTPWNTGYFAYGTRKDAVKDAIQWAESEDIPLYLENPTEEEIAMVEKMNMFGDAMRMFTHFDDTYPQEVLDNGYMAYSESQFLDLIWALGHSVDNCDPYFDVTTMYSGEYHTINWYSYDAPEVEPIGRDIYQDKYGMIYHMDEADCLIGPFCTYFEARQHLIEYVKWLDGDMDSDFDGSIAECDYIHSHTVTKSNGAQYDIENRFDHLIPGQVITLIGHSRPYFVKSIDIDGSYNILPVPHEDEDIPF